MTRRKQTAYASTGPHPVLAEAGARWAVEVGANRGGVCVRVEIKVYHRPR